MTSGPAPESPGASAAPAATAPSRRSLNIAVQLAGFAIGIGLLWYCGSLALRPENRGQLQKLADAGPLAALALAGLSLATLLINGLLFWLGLAPVQRLSVRGVLATNAVAMFLSYLPLKLSVLFRLFIHTKRDGVPLLRVGAWFGAVAAVMAAVLGPLVLVSWLHPRVDALWIALAGAGVLGASGMLLGIARLLSDEGRWAWFERLAGRLPGRLGTIAKSRLLPRAHEGVRMCADPRCVGASVALRLMDAAVHSARLALAAWVIGQPLTADQAVIAGSAFFLIGVVAPTGQLGVREAGTAGIMAALHSEGLVVAVLMVSAAEAAVVLLAAIAGGAYLRLDRLLGRR